MKKAVRSAMIRRSMIRYSLVFLLLGVLLRANSVRADLIVSVGANFKGTTIGGSGFIPPDTMGAVGSSQVVEMINGAYAVYNKSGVLQGRVTLDSFWNTAFANAGTITTANSSFDPRILYDKGTDRWYAVSVDTRNSADSRILVAVTTGGDLNVADWRGFVIDADTAGTRWADFPTVGINADGLYIANNMFDVTGGANESTTVTFVGVPISSLTAATPSITGFKIQENINPNTTGFALQPAVDLDSSSQPLPALSAFNKSAGFLKTSVIPTNFLTAGALDTTGGFISVTSRSGPPLAHQPGANDNVNTGDSRFSGNVVLQDGKLWGIHSVDINGRSALEWYQIDPLTNGLLQSGTITDAALDLYFPSIAVNNFGNAVIGFSGSSDITAISSYFTVGETLGGTTTFGALTQTGVGAGTYQILDSGGRNRWGDYSATVIDPTNEQTFWTFQEYLDGDQNWAIRITEIRLSNASAVPEPSSLALVASGILGLWWFRRRRRSSAANGMPA